MAVWIDGEALDVKSSNFASHLANCRERFLQDFTGLSVEIAEQKARESFDIPSEAVIAQTLEDGTYVPGASVGRRHRRLL